ncbi:type VI secretion system tip protein VgrG [Limnobacter humi]|uniref:Type VI secretion system tip protein VgrG n=1 Tax=Limnobacter humi TaxID=1778671 RepID=A0ABT1WFD0_9BURK|nr:type VI secretion system tip protein TssI/VgrG [Limnobacter humi]MCQ8895462.1 type VI secretion system tip protein VgrG [Limnobacter humi]
MNRMIQFSGSAPHEPLVFHSATLLEGLSEHACATLLCHAESARLDPDLYLGKTLAFSFETRDQQHRHFQGVVVQMQLGDMASQGACLYQFELRSWTWLLTRNQDFRVYQQQSVVDIAKSVLARHAHPAVQWRDETRQQHRVWDYCVQFGESDYHFLSRLFEQEGLYFYFEHSEQGHTLVLVDDMAAHRPSEDCPSLTVNSIAHGGRLTEQEVVQRWTATKRIQAHRHAHSDYNFTTPSAALLTQQAGQVLPYNQPFELFEYPGEYDTATEGTAYSQLRQQESAAQAWVFSGHSNARGLRVGRVCSIACPDNPVLTDTVLLTRTQIGLREAPVEGHGGGMSIFQCDFEAIPHATPFRAVRKARKPLAKGPLPALVVGPEGQEIYTDEFGRIKVQFYWDRYGQRNAHSSCWVRVAFPAAGKGWGFVTVPRIGQEVWVSFEDGDPDRPLVTGVLYNAEQPVPYPLPDQKTVSGWRTRSTEHGTASNFNELRFDDKRGEEYVWFQAERDYRALIKHHSQVEIGADSHLLVNGHLIEQIKQDVSRHVLGKVMAQIEGMLNVRVNDDVRIQVQGALDLGVQSDMTVNTGGTGSLESTGSLEVRAGQGLNASSPASINLHAGSALHLTAGAGLSFTCGASSLLVSPAGVFLNGRAVLVNAGGSVSVASTAKPGSPDEPEKPAPVSPPVDPLAGVGS